MSVQAAARGRSDDCARVGINRRAGMREPRLGFSILGVVLLVGVIFAIRLGGPWKLMDLDQERPVQYAMDVYLHDRWIVQTDSSGDIASKPPIYPWSVAVFSHVLGGVGRLAVYLPTAIGIAGASIVILLLGRSVFGAWAGLFAAIAFCCSTYSFKMVHLARTDPLFCMWVALASACAWLAWQSRTEHRTPAKFILGFWAFATLATLTKGPLGVVIAAMGLLAIFWERRSRRDDPPSPTKDVQESAARSRVFWLNLLGACGLVLVAGVWLFAAYSVEGRAVVDKLLGRELFGHALRSDSGEPPLVGFWKTWVYFLSRYAPWSIVAFIAVVRVLLRPSMDDRTRRFERFCACWLMGGLVMFSVFPHQRPDLLLPLIPAAALLVGRQIETWLTGTRSCCLGVGAIVIVALAMETATYHFLETRVEVAPAGDSPTRWDKIVRTREVRTFAGEIDRSGIGELRFAGGPMALQIFLGVKEPFLLSEEARALLLGDERVWIVVESMDGLGGAAREVLVSVGARGERLVVVTNR